MLEQKQAVEVHIYRQCLLQNKYVHYSLINKNYNIELVLIIANENTSYNDKNTSDSSD